MRRRIAVTAALAIGLAFGTAGCTFLAPQATLIKYNASDGVDLNVGKLQVRNAFVISPNGKDANLIGVLINTSDSPIAVKLQFSSGSAGTSKTLTEHLKAGEVLSLGNPGVKQVVFRKADVKPGALLTVYIQYGNEQGKNLQLPVLNGSQSYYTGLAPSPAPTTTSTPTPTPTPTSTTVTG